jgi:hypothetical protein
VTDWIAFKLIVAALVAVLLGTMLIVFGMQQAQVHPYKPSPSRVVPHTYDYPPSQ